MKDYILFDMDGTLFDTSEGITQSARYALARFGIEEQSRENLLRFIGPPLTDSFEEFYGFSKERAIEAKKKFRERYESIGVFECSPIEGAEECLKALSRFGKTLCVATCKPERFAVMILEKYGMTRYFKEIVGSEMDERRTHKDEVIEEVFSRLNAGDVRARSVMVGDREHDISGAKKCGIASVGVRVGFARGNELERAGADYITQDFRSLTELLMRI